MPGYLKWRPGLPGKYIKSGSLFPRRAYGGRLAGISKQAPHASTVLKSVDIARRAAPRAAIVFRRARANPGAANSRIIPIRGHSYGKPHFRRVTVLTKVSWSSGPGFPSARAHMRYLERENTSRDGEKSVAYDAGGDADSGGFLERCSDDRFQYRITVAFAEPDIEELQTPDNFIRRLASEIGQDLGTRLDWIAVNHFNTPQTHTHMVLRCQDDSDRPIYLMKNYHARGIHQRASELMTAELGPRPDHAVAQMIERDLTTDRPGALDRDILAVTGNGSRHLTPEMMRKEMAVGPDRVHARLRHLQTLGLAWREENIGWRVVPETLSVLEDMDIRMRAAREIGRSRTPGWNIGRDFAGNPVRELTMDQAREILQPERNRENALKPHRAIPSQRELSHGSPDNTAAGGRLKSAFHRMFAQPFRESAFDRTVSDFSRNTPDRIADPAITPGIDHGVGVGVGGGPESNPGVHPGNNPGVDRGRGTDTGQKSTEGVRRNWLFSGGDSADSHAHTPAHDNPLGPGGFAEAGQDRTGQGRTGQSQIEQRRGEQNLAPARTPVREPVRTTTENLPEGGPDRRKREPALPPF